jgi:hypothetical protein
MWPVTFSWITTACAVLLCAFAVKLTDDFLDQQNDLKVERCNWALYLGPGTMVYATLFLALAASINSSVSLSLFFASYIVGMFNDLLRILPSRLRGWQESSLVMIAGVLLFGWINMLFSLLFIIAVQCTDDCLDYRLDCITGQRNIANRVGLMECGLIGLTALITAWWLSEQLFFPVLSGTLVYYGLAMRFEGVRQ